VKMLVKKTVLATSVALATLIAAQAADAQEYLSHEAAYAQRHHAAPGIYDAEGNPRVGFGPRVTVQPNDVVTGNREIGRDPDPFIRGEILRHSDSGWPD
jgi:hypothetical protein